MKRKSSCLSAASAAILLSMTSVLCACSGGSAIAAANAVGVAAAAGGMRDKTSLQLAKEMSPGWNLGNSLEAINTANPYVWGSKNFDETAWGNPVVTQELLNAVKAAGFKTVRIPVAWSQYTDKDGNISPQWMARVREVVGYAHRAGLYAIINVHWDGGWMNHPTYANQAAINGKLTRFWTQIATAFRDDDDHLLFAGTNEVGMENTYGAPPAEWVTVQNSFNQTFVNAVRATGGNNASRHLVVQGYFTNIDVTYASNTVPADTVAGRLFFEVHYYDPYHFALDDKSAIWQWGKDASDPNSVEAWANEAWADSEFDKMKTRFVDKGVPVILGEYGAISKTEYDPAGVYRKYWTQYVTKSAYQHGLVPVWWDNGYTANHTMGLFNRASGAQAYPDLINTIVNASR